MKKKTINAVICKKFDEFLESITDNKVKALVSQNTIITGGCIASMLLKEDVNDFDIYFTNKETVKAVAGYYVDQFVTMADAPMFKGGGKNILIRVTDGDDPGTYADLGTNPGPGRIKIHIKSAGIAGEKGTDDYQYFESRPPEEGEGFIDNVISNVSKVDDMPGPDVNAKPKYRPVFLSANAITLSDKIQLVLRFYGEADTVHETYDFIHCTNYWTSKDRQVVLNQAALESLMAKELVYVGSKYPLCSIIRLRKFLKRGWTINAGQILKQCFQVSKLNLSDVAVLEDQLIGVDVAYFAQLVQAISDHEKKEKENGKEFNLDYGYLATIIDKMF